MKHTITFNEEELNFIVNCMGEYADRCETRSIVPYAPYTKETRLQVMNRQVAVSGSVRMKAMLALGNRTEP